MKPAALLFGLALGSAVATAAEPTNVAATTYYRTFYHGHPVLKTIKPGEVIATKTLDSGGVDEKDQTKSEPFNPLTGPFYVEGAEAGDALVVHLNKVRMNRDWGWTAYRLGLFSLTPEAVENVYSSSYKADYVRKGRSNLVRWAIDREKKTVKLTEPKSAVLPMEFPAKPMLGCIGVAPAGDFAPTSGPSGSYGGNLDYNKIGEGATVYLPVAHKGALLFLGDGHALQADGEPTGTGVETSMDVEFSVELKKGAKLTGPRVETADEIISLGSQPEFASALDNGLKMATTDMVDWLTADYKLEPWAAHLLIGYQGQYDVVTVAGTMALRLSKDRLPKAPAAASNDEKPPSPAIAPVVSPPKADPKPSAIAERTKGMTKLDGFVPLYWDESLGKLWMEVSRFKQEFLYQVALATGLGSNPVGLDRGQLGGSHVVTFERAGPKVLLVEPNYKFRAVTDRKAERKAVEDSFAKSVHWGFRVEAEDKDTGAVLVDATAFFLRDAHGVVDRLRSSKQGSYRLDESRSAIDAAHTKAFPKNTEVEATLTFATDAETGRLVAQTAPTAKSVTVSERHSLVELPALGPDFTTRGADPRVGVFGVDYYDFATPVTEPVERQVIARFRLRKKDPKAEVSEPVAPIVYYVDPGAPEPVRSALVEGASWWDEAFAAAGYKGAFKVEVLPDDADPMDLRYNVIQWVHRSTRGWSYGSNVVDPRTGEILKGRVTLDSLRARQDSLIGAGLAAQPPAGACLAADGPGAEHLAAFDPTSQPAAMVLARIRQLSAHEVGHTLGFAHNFAASACGRSSVMDYPAPVVKVSGDVLDLSDAYAKGIGAYDKFAVRYAYSHFPDGTDEPKALGAVVRKGLDDGLLFLSDADARPAGAAHPLASLWDNGDDPVATLRHEMEVRRVGLARFGLGTIPEGTPLSELEAKLLPLYLHHRYQLQAAVKTLGGVRYTYAVKDGGKASPGQVVAFEPGDRQRAALDAVLETVTPKALAIPAAVLDLIPPQAYNRPDGTAERFSGKTGLTFDPIAAATVAADLAVSGLLNPQRAARVVEGSTRDKACPSLADVIAAVLDATWRSKTPRDPREAALARTVRYVVVDRLIDLAGDETAAPAVRAEATAGIREVGKVIDRGGDEGRTDAHERAVRDEIVRFLGRPDATNQRPAPVTPPPGDPIGGD